MKKYILIFVIVAISLYFILSQKSQDLKVENNPVESYQKERLKIGKKLEKKIQIYGKVIDGDTNKPLPGVLLEISYVHGATILSSIMGSSIIKATSDENGLFFLDISTFGISLRKIFKDGYWEKGQKNRFSNPNLINYIPDKNNPIVFKLYKEVKDNYLVKKKFRPIRVSDGEKIVNYFDILKGYNIVKEQDNYDFNCNVERIASKTLISFNGFDSACSFYLSENDFLTKDELSKFSNTLSIDEIKNTQIRQTEEKRYFLYIRFGKLQLYAKTKISIDMYNDKSCLDFDLDLNPYGEYYFETFDESKVDSSVLVNINRDFEKMLKEGVLPKRADLKKYLNITISENKPNPIKEKKNFDTKTNSKNAKMSFYGKAVDDKGKSIPGAIVVFSYFFYNEKNEILPGFKKIKADQSGLFVLEEVWGYKLKVEDIFKFEYFRNRVIRGNFDDRYFLSNFSASYAPNKNNPEVFQLINELSGNFNDSNQYFAPRIIKTGEEKDFYHKFLNEFESSDSENYDLKVNIQLLKDKCIVNISSLEEKSGFIINNAENINISDQISIRNGSFELPISDDGKNYKRHEKYLLVKFLKGRYYAKLHLDFLIGNSECQFYAESRINLFGTKEFDDFKKIKYTGSIYKHLRDRNELRNSDGEMESVLDKNDFIKDYNDPFIKAQFKVPPETDPRLEIHVDEMKELLQYRIFEEDEKK